MKTGLIVELGLVEYAATWELQRRVAAARKAGAIPDVLLLCEHPHVITLGRNGTLGNLLASRELLQEMNVSFHESDRGGDITYHGPGQLVGYPILNLAEIRRDIAWYVRNLEEAMIRATAEFGVTAHRIVGCPGVWVHAAIAVNVPDAPSVQMGPERCAVSGDEKLAAIGVHLSRWVTSHGFAYNISTDLRYFDLIVPCGIVGKRATSLETLLGRPMSTNEAAPRIADHLGELLGLTFRAADRGALEALLCAYEEQPAGTLV